MSLPVLIISFNNHEFVANTIAQLSAWGVDDLTVIDNASNWDATRAYLDTLEGQGCKLIRNRENVGHLCWARPEIYDRLPDKFCVTDPDLQFHPRLPHDFIEVMAALADRYEALKVGFALDLSDSDLMFQDPDYHLGQSIVEWERKFWDQRVEGETLELYAAGVDTTFHVFNKRGRPERQLRVAGDYTAKHLPWYRRNSLISSEGMRRIYEHASSVSTVARLQMREIAKQQAAEAAQHAASQAKSEVAAPAPVHLYQIAYSQATRATLESGYLMLDNVANPRPDWFEYWPIRRFLLDEVLEEKAFYGFFSPKFGSKTNLSHAQVTDFVRQAAASGHDVALFSPQPDMGAFFLNVFEQGEAFDAGLIAATEGFLRQIGEPQSLQMMVMDSRQIVFSNYFVARPAFWRRWLALGEKLFAICEGPDQPLRTACMATTTYEGAQRKVFMQERLASLILATEPSWRATTANSFGFAWSTSRFREHPTEAVVSDALKTAYREHGFAEYMQAYAEVRQRFRDAARPSAAASVAGQETAA